MQSNSDGIDSVEMTIRYSGAPPLTITVFGRGKDQYIQFVCKQWESLRLKKKSTHVIVFGNRLSSTPGSGRSLGEGNGIMFQYFCMENSIDKGTWWATVHGVTKSWTQLRDRAFILNISFAKNLACNLMLLKMSDHENRIRTMN